MRAYTAAFCFVILFQQAGSDFYVVVVLNELTLPISVLMQWPCIYDVTLPSSMNADVMDIADFNADKKSTYESLSLEVFLSRKN